jgi:hypothetical protein
MTGKLIVIVPLGEIRSAEHERRKMTILGLGVFLLILGILFEIFKVALNIAGALVGFGFIVLIIGIALRFASTLR